MVAGATLREGTDTLLLRGTRRDHDLVDKPEYERWLAEASRALEAARIQAPSGLHNWSCFLAEQSAQLALKALLHGIGLAPWGHDLPDLGARAREACGTLWPTALDPALRELSRHYIPARYPDAHAAGSPGSHYGREESQQAIAQAARVVEVVSSIWSEIVREAEREEESDA